MFGEFLARHSYLRAATLKHLCHDSAARDVLTGDAAAEHRSPDVRRREVVMKFAVGLCLMLAFGATAASAESPSPLKTNLFKPHEDVRAWSLQTVVEGPTPVLAREVPLTDFTLRKEGDRVLQAQLTIGSQFVPSNTRNAEVRGQALITVHMYFRTQPSP
jgi:hypothetical protein